VKGPSAGRLTKDGITIHDADEFEGMRAAGRLAAEVLDMIAEYVVPGVTTEELDQRCHQYILDGWFGDNSRMYVAGKLSRKAERLLDVTHDSLMLAIDQVKPGNTFGDIGAAIQTYAESKGMSVVRDFCGHGLGRVFHSPPNVLHYGRQGTGAVLEPGMFFTIEPMINLGRPETKVLADDWTAVTRDKSLSAQFEHSVAVVEDGVEIFTLSPKDMFHPTYKL